MTHLQVLSQPPALPPFPSGWFQVAYSDELPAGGVLPLHYFGRDLVLYRGEAGLARVLDAHCPHLGAHLGHGGRVEGEHLRCPFHGWCFDGDGRCVAIPYARGHRIPPTARLGVWPVEEVNGAIMVYHHVEGEAPPAGPVPRAPQLADPDWLTVGRFRWKYATHLQEMVENAIDPMHLVELHGGVLPAECELSEVGSDLRVVTHFSTDPARLGFPGADIVPARIEALLHGHGLQIIEFDAVVQGLVFLCFTPIDGRLVDARMVIAIKKLDDEEATRLVATVAQKTLIDQFEQDIQIWENKIYRQRPVLVEGDGPFGRVRRWTRQFYPEPGERRVDSRDGVLSSVSGA